MLGPIVGERSVLLLDGAEHLRHRRLLLPPFHGQRMQAYADVMRESADLEIDAWPVGEPFALLPSMQSLTLRGDHARGVRLRARARRARSCAPAARDDRADGAAPRPDAACTC